MGLSTSTGFDGRCDRTLRHTCPDSTREAVGACLGKRWTGLGCRRFAVSRHFAHSIKPLSATDVRLRFAVPGASKPHRSMPIAQRLQWRVGTPPVMSPGSRVIPCCRRRFFRNGGLRVRCMHIPLGSRMVKTLGFSLWNGPQIGRMPQINVPLCSGEGTQTAAGSHGPCTVFLQSACEKNKKPFVICTVQLESNATKASGLRVLTRRFPRKMNRIEQVEQPQIRQHTRLSDTVKNNSIDAFNPQSCNKAITKL